MTWEAIATFLLMLSIVVICLMGARISHWVSRCRVERMRAEDWEEYAEWLEHRGWEGQAQHTQVPPLPESRKLLREQFRES